MMHIHSMKEATEGKKIESISEPDLLLVPLLEKFGRKPEPVVKVGDKVKKYQLIARSPKDGKGKVHAPVSGTVQKIVEWPQVEGSFATTIFIENDHKGTEAKAEWADYDLESPEKLLEIVELAGIVGLGGAQFPTDKKFDRKGKRVDTFIINGAECEPYLTADYAQMAQRTKELLEGILIVDKILDAGEIVITYEHSNRELDEQFHPLLDQQKYSKIRTQIVPDEYPQGGELQLAKTVTGIEIKKGDVPLEQGVIVSNVGTVLAVHDAVRYGKPVVERVITISGERVKRPGNYKILIGTPLNHILSHGKLDPTDTVIVAGGPMMSPHVTDLTVPLHKGSLGLLAIPKDHVRRKNCIWCAYCVDVCPMKLMPMKYDQLYRKGHYKRMEDYYLKDCIECGACEYICPSNVPLIESIKEGKAKLKKMKDAADR